MPPARRPAARRACTGLSSSVSCPRDAILPAPAICPDCTLIIRPIFAEATTGSDQMPSATPRQLAAAITECIDAGARVINLSLALAQPSSKGEQALEEAVDRGRKTRRARGRGGGN